MIPPRFGTAGLADSYTVKKFDPAAIAAYTAGFGLTAFEYQCGRGVRLAHDKAAALGAACADRDIALSVPRAVLHQYVEPRGGQAAAQHRLPAAKAAPSSRRWAGGASSSIPDSCSKQSREEALGKRRLDDDGPRCQSLRRGRV